MSEAKAEKARLGMGPGEWARGVRVVMKREIDGFFDSSIAYIYLIAFVATTAGIYMNDFFLRAVVDMTPYFNLLPALSIIFLPALTMRIWSEEKRTLTFELIMTLPLHPFQIVIGKYLAALLFYMLTLAASLPIVVMLASLGSPDLGLIFSGYLGAALLGMVFIAFGAFISGLTANQIVAFVGSAFVAFIFVFSGDETAVAALDGLTPTLQLGTFLYESVSILPRYEALVQGVMKASDLIYFLVMTGLFVWLNGVSVQRTAP